MKASVLFLITFCLNAECICQEKDSIIINTNTEFYKRSKGISISKTEFDSLVTVLNFIIEKKAEFSIENHIQAIRIYNTVWYYHLNTTYDSNIEYFYTNYKEDYLSLSIRTLDAKPSKGKSHYSKKYNTRVGGLPNENSLFFISAYDGQSK
jgi:hypothetical protein